MQTTQAGAHGLADVEKDNVEHIDNIDTNGSESDSKGGPDNLGFTLAEQKKIIRRIDLRLVVTVGVMYCVSLMDRTNLSAANIAGYVHRISSMYIAIANFLSAWRPSWKWKPVTDM